MRFPGILSQRRSREFPAAGNLAAYFRFLSAEFCKLCPKTADFAPWAGKRAGIYGNFICNCFWQHYLRRLTESECESWQGKSREFPPSLWSPHFDGSHAMALIAAEGTLRAKQAIRHARDSSRVQMATLHAVCTASGSSRPKQSTSAGRMLTDAPTQVFGNRVYCGSNGELYPRQAAPPSILERRHRRRSLRAVILESD